MIEGGCFCGAIRYAIQAGDYPVANCHCSMCRRTSAAPFVTWMVVPIAAFEYRRGTPRVLQSSASGTRFFCARCGTPIACINTQHPDIIDITTGSLDAPEDFPPTMAIHEDTRLPWLARVENGNL